ncbi:MAG: DUF4179 domain-containing protein [Clostridia bacterium]|nr:DUF4179 domain-containing protein [Clostridia bacterium]
MTDAFDNLRQVFPQMPSACDEALSRTLYSLEEKKQKAVLPMARRAVILAAAMLAVCCVAGAAFYPQIISWFGDHYGSTYAAWMEKGNVALPQTSVEAEGAVFTVDQVLTRGRSLYVLGKIKPQAGYLLVDFDGSAQDPFGYNVHYGDKAPEGAPTILEKAQETQNRIRYVHCALESIGVDGGAMLAPGSWGSGVTVQRDGSLVFTLEVEDGLVLEEGSQYTLGLKALVYEANEDGSLNWEKCTEQAWEVIVEPQRINEE